MVLQLVMDMAGTFPILGYLLIKKIFKKHMTAQKYIWILRLSIILYLCPFQEFKYLILPEKLLERFNFADFWGIAGKKISGFEVVNIPSLFGDYYVIPRGIFLVTVIWLSLIHISKVNIALAGMEDKITLISGDAAEVLKELSGSWDFIFMDAAKGQYIHLSLIHI